MPKKNVTTTITITLSVDFTEDEQKQYIAEMREDNPHAEWDDVAKFGAERFLAYVKDMVAMDPDDEDVEFTVVLDSVTQKEV